MTVGATRGQRDIGIETAARFPDLSADGFDRFRHAPPEGEVWEDGAAGIDVRPCLVMGVGVLCRDTFALSGG